MEFKDIQIDRVGLKFASDGSEVMTFSGYASVFGGVDTYGDTIIPGAYKKTLAKRDRPVQMRWNHYGDVIGKWTRIEEDEKGLYVEGQLTPGHSKAQDVYASLKHGAVTGLSIGFRPLKIRELGDGKRELHEIDLIEISIVESPADNAAHIANVKSAIEEAKSLKEVEAILRDAGGFSRADACALVARVKSLELCDKAPEHTPETVRSVFKSVVTG
jgi:HK97 family phage prohead protease